MAADTAPAGPRIGRAVALATLDAQGRVIESNAALQALLQRPAHGGSNVVLCSAARASRGRRRRAPRMRLHAHERAQAHRRRAAAPQAHGRPAARRAVPAAAPRRRPPGVPHRHHGRARAVVAQLHQRLYQGGAHSPGLGTRIVRALLQQFDARLQPLRSGRGAGFLVVVPPGDDPDAGAVAATAG